MYFGSLVTEMLLHGFTSHADAIFNVEPTVVFPDTGVWDENIWDFLLAKAFYLLIKGKYEDLEEMESPFPITQENYVHMTLVELIRILGVIRMGNYEEAKIRLDHIDKLIDNCPPTVLDKLTVIQFTIRSYLNLERGEIEEAFSIIKKTNRMLKFVETDYPLISENFERYWYSYLKNNLGLVKIYLGKYEEAEQEFHEVLSILNDFGYSQIKFYAWMNLSYTCHILGKFKAAIESLEQAAEAITVLGNESDLPYVLREFGRTNYELGNFGQAESFFQKAYEHAKEFASPKMVIERVNDLHSFYCSQNNFEAAEGLIAEIKQFCEDSMDRESFIHIISLIFARHKLHFGRFAEILKAKSELVSFIREGRFSDILQRLEARILVITIQLMEYRISGSEADLQSLIFLVAGLIEEARRSKLREIQIRGESLLLHLYLEIGDFQRAEEVTEQMKEEKEFVKSTRIEHLIDQEIHYFKTFLLEREQKVQSLEKVEDKIINPILEEYLNQVSQIVKRFS